MGDLQARSHNLEARREENLVYEVMPTPPKLTDYLMVLWRRKGMIVGTVLLGMLAALAYLWLAEPVYRATAILELHPNEPQILSEVEQVGAGPGREETFLNTQYALLQSRAVAERVVDRLSEKEQGRLLDDRSAAEASRPRLVRAIRQRVSVYAPKDSRLVEVSFDSTEAELAAAVANAVAASYVALQSERRLATTKKARDWLGSQLEKLKRDLQASETKLAAFKKKHGLLDSDSLAALRGQELSGLKETLLEARSERIHREVTHEQVQAARRSGDLLTLAPLLDSPSVQELQMERNRLETRLEQLRTHYGPNAPKVISTRAELTEVRQRLDSEIRAEIAAIEKTYQQAATRESRLEQRRREVSNDAREQSDLEFELAALERDVETNRQLYEALRERIKETDLSSTLETTVADVVDQAAAPQAPYAPQPRRAFGAAGLLSLALGLVLAFLREGANRTFQTTRQLEQELRLPALGAIPDLHGRARLPNLLRAPARPQEIMTEALGEIRTRLEVGGIDGQRPQVIMVTSALQGEGKSTLATHLAAVYGDLGRTLLVDADLRRPGLGPLSGPLGLTDLASGDSELKACIRRDPRYRNLFVLGRGTGQVKPLEFLASEALARTFEMLRRQFQTIIVDTAPVLPVSDALILGQHSDGAILAVRAGKTGTEAIDDSIHRLRSSGIGILGVTLAQVDVRHMGTYKGYAYG